MEAKRSASEKILSLLIDKYEFCTLESINQENLERIRVIKWENSCEKCFQRNHTKENCKGPIRNKHYK